MFLHHADAMRFKTGPSEGAVSSPWGPPERPRTVGPVALLAHVLPHEVRPETLPVDADVRPHPHIGLVAVSYLIDGYVTHRDSRGARFEIGPGGACFTVAGRGVVHSERMERLRVLGGRMEMFQILLALPDGQEDIEPSSRHVAQVAAVSGAGVTVREVVGEPLVPAFVHDLELAPGARHGLPSSRERALYVSSGDLEVLGRRCDAHQVMVLEPGPVEIHAPRGARVIVFGGEPVGPRYLWWNYLHSSLASIEAARADWRAGRVKLPPGDTESFTPAPPNEGRPLRLLNA